MTGEVIKSFLVGLGFDVDDGSLAKFNKSIQTAAVRVTALYATVSAAAAGIIYGISDISEGFEKMGYEYRIIAPAINKALVLRNELLKAYSAAGINITKVIQASVKLNMSLSKTKFAMEAIYKSVGSKFFGLLTKQSDAFRQKLYQNMPKIQAGLEKFVKFVFKAVEAVTTLALRVWSILTRVYDFFLKLNTATNGWAGVILAVVAAWELLNLSFLATPLGMIIAGLVGILALFDDFKTWEEGGESLFDWSYALPVINAVKSALSSLADVWLSIVDVIGNVVLAFYQLFHMDFKGFFGSLVDAAKAAIDIFVKLWDTVKGLGDFAAKFGEFATSGLGGFFGGSKGDNVAKNVQANPATQPLGNPIGGNTQNSQTNQNVNQQTNINISGSADANQTGQAVAGQQSKVNFDMVRNMKGATR
jgi:hypothetical protein